VSSKPAGRQLIDVSFISWSDLKLSISCIDQTGEMGYTYGMKYFGDNAAEAKNTQDLLTITEEGKRLARHAGGE